jgi:hypothetical protein
MKRIIEEDLEIFKPYQLIPIDESILICIYDEIMKIVEENHFIAQRVSVLEQIGCRLFFNYGRYQIPYYGDSRSYFNTPTKWKIGNMTLSYNLENFYNKRWERSYYIQVSSYQVNISGLTDRPCTVFVEIPERSVKNGLRKLKLRNLERVCRTRAE